MKNTRITIINLTVVLILVIGLTTLGVFTADQMGAFYDEPRVNVKAEYAGTDAPVIRVATDYDFCPNSYYNSDGELSGLYIEVITEAANRMGMVPEFYTDDWPGCREMLTNGDVDVLLGLEIFSNMEGTLRTIPISSDELNVYGKKKVNSAAALSGKRIALMARSVITSTFDLGCEYVEYYTNTEILEAVANGEVDYGICHGAVSEKIIEKNDFDLIKGMAIMKSFPALAVSDLAPELQQSLNTVIKEMAEDGTLYRLKTKWITDFTMDRSFSHVIKSNLAFYGVTVMSMLLLLCITLIFRLDTKRKNQYITTLLDYQKQLQTSNAEIERANRAKTEFLSHMSHDIRTPMNGIMGMVGIIRKNSENAQRVEECLDNIDVASNHLLSLINDVLDMSKLESGDIEQENIAFSLDEELMHIHTIVDLQAQEKQIDLQFEDSMVQHRSLIGSPGHFRRILLNLLSNALKYTPSHGQVRVVVNEESKKNNKVILKLLVQDTGTGMSKEFVEKSLYKPFTQENDSVRTKYQGTGLGMSIVYELVQIMEGEISVESELGKGTAFTVLLPFEIDERSAVNEKKKIADKDIRGMRILVAEDNDLNREIAECVLEDAGASVTGVADGKQAVEAFEASQEGYFDAILLDIMMPVMDGLEAARQIRALKRADAGTVPIIAMTANAFKEDKRKSEEAGMNAHLTKPLNNEKLFETLAYYRK